MIRIENLTKNLGKTPIFLNTNLAFEKGKVYAITGKSGSGKTTLLNIIAMLENYDSGEVFYNSQPLKKRKAFNFFRYELGYLFQNFGLLDGATIKENLELGLVGERLSKKSREQKELDVLKKVDLSYLTLDKKIFELSGGEAQRVALAKIILKNPPLILADEPTAALDPKTSKEVMKLLLSLRKEDRIIIIATHNPIIWELADEVINIQKVSNL